MSYLKSSALRFIAIASAVGLAACGASQQGSTATMPRSDEGNPSMTHAPGTSGIGETGGVWNGGNSQPAATSQTSTSHTLMTPESVGSLGRDDHPTYGPSPSVGGGFSSVPSGPAAIGAMGATSAMAGDPMDLSNANEAQIAAVLRAINQGEIQEAQLASNKAKLGDARRFAQHMITAHREMLEQDSKLLAQLKITPSDNPLSNQLGTATQNEIATLETMNGRDFDRAYIDAQVRGHQKALELIDHMVARVQNAELKTQIQNARPRVVLHLREAERILQSMQGMTKTSSGKPVDHPADSHP